MQCVRKSQPFTAILTIILRRLWYNEGEFFSKCLAYRTLIGELLSPIA